MSQQFTNINYKTASWIIEQTKPNQGELNQLSYNQSAQKSVVFGLQGQSHESYVVLLCRYFQE